MPKSTTATKRKVGRPPKLTPKLQAAVVEVLSGGNSIRIACDYVGIHQSQFCRWMDEEAFPAKEFREFRVAIKKAIAQADKEDVEIIRKAAKNGDWKAAMTRLERRYPQEWGRRQVEVQHTGKKGGPIQHDVIFRGSPKELAEAAGEAVHESPDQTSGEEVGTVSGDPADN